MSELSLHPGFLAPDVHQLPEGWVAKPLSLITSTHQGGKLGLTKEAHYLSSGVSAFSAAGCDGFVEKAEFKNTEAVVLSAIGANCGRCFFASGDWTTLANVQALIPNEEIDPKFLFYRVNQENFWERSGSAQPFIKPSSIGKSWIAFPKAITRQKKIASILSAIDTAIEKAEALIAKHQQIKAGLMHDLFTRGVLPNGQLRPPREQAPELYRETPIGWRPASWQYELLDQLATRGSGHTPNKNQAAYWNGGIKWVSLADSHRLDKLYISDTELQISAEGIRNSSAVLHPAGIVVLSRDAGVGKSAITTEPMAVSQHFMCWRCDKQMDKHFLYYWLQHNKRTFENIAMGSTILTIGLPYFKKMKIACPVDLDEQVMIADRLRALDTQLFKLEADAAKLREQKLGLMQDLLTGKVRVSPQ
jgi:restriction endonuclease S subunit